MSEKENGYVGFEYIEVPAARSMESMYVDSYTSFGWKFEGSSAGQEGSERIRLKFKRDRKLRNKAELTSLQRQFEALERSKTTAASIAAFSIGLVGSAFLGGAVFAYLTGSLPLMVVLAIPGFLGWIVPYFCYRKLCSSRERQIIPLVEQKNDEIYAVCEHGCRLLNA